MSDSLVRAYPPSVAPDGDAVWLIFRDGELLFPEQPDGSKISLIVGSRAVLTPLVTQEPVFVGSYQGRPCFAVSVLADGELAAGWQSLGLRALYQRLSENELALAGYASEILYWLRTSRFCPVCGHLTEQRSGDWGRHCPQCGHIGYPRVSPAVLMLVHDGVGRILLSHKPGWGAFYSILAGFVEPGESLEECVHREVREEVGLDVTDLTYVGSQPWPFPHQLMVGFTARFHSGTITLDTDELDDARWFSVNELPDLPSPMSLSRRVIDAWISRQ